MTKFILASIDNAGLILYTFNIQVKRVITYKITNSAIISIIPLFSITLALEMRESKLEIALWRLLKVGHVHAEFISHIFINARIVSSL